MIREYTLYDFSSFRFVEVCFMAQDMVYVDSQKNVIIGRSVLEMLIRSFLLTVLLSSIVLYLLLREVIEVSKYYHGNVYFSFHLYPFLLQIFFISIFCGTQTFRISICFSLSYVVFFVPKSTLYNVNRATSTFF